MNNNEQLYSIALGLCPGIGHIGAKRLVDTFGSAEEVFQRRKEIPDMLPEVHTAIVEALDCPEAFRRAEQELTFVEKNHLDCLTLTHPDYPARLRECPDAPLALFFKGACDFNRQHVVSIVGTRRATTYGKDFCNTFIRELSELCPDILIVSGLAYGIDIHSHRAALANRMSTVGVLAHGLDRIYPSVHRKTAIEMLPDGGLLTEFLSGTEPERYNFVSRNRIVAGMADATIVVESAEKGGSLITADLANGYSRDCFAIPGRINDAASAGCNQLIRDNKAAVILTAEDLLKAMRWETHSQRPEAVQRNLFPTLTPEEEQIVNILTAQGDLHINMLATESNVPVYRISALLFELEMKGILKALPGSIYHLL